MANLTRLAPPGSEGERLLRQLDLARLPRHVALIMDGNGRWARKRHLPRIAGHRAGIASVRDIVEACGCLDLQVLTVYAFSKENWKRPKAEVDFLMDLLREYLRKELDDLHRNGVRVQVVGRMHELPPAVQDELHRAVEATRANEGLVLNLALSYGGRAEIVDACRALIRLGVRPEEVDEASFAKSLYTAGQPEPDLVVRTGGEMRVSNFLLWQIAYAELVVSEVLWPDFRRNHLLAALLEYQTRERRFGGLSPREAAEGSPALVQG
ncbi:MAG TPA: isoprenyl transferase [Candidatus Polarisedimenticolaceae bacterium]|nr:isoprenyl transferase [Candidatus Polarisedimenticolaceae bacterium]